MLRGEADLALPYLMPWSELSHGGKMDGDGRDCGNPSGDGGKDGEKGAKRRFPGLHLSPYVTLTLGRLASQV